MLSGYQAPILCILSGILSNIFPANLSGIPSNKQKKALSGILFYYLSEILSGILSGIRSGILSDIYSTQSDLSGIVSHIPFDILAVHLAFYLTFFLAFHPAFYLALLFGMLSLSGIPSDYLTEQSRKHKVHQKDINKCRKVPSLTAQLYKE
jgi:ABC-type protease/lipase transport system fused ATPase/permease subunit